MSTNHLNEATSDATHSTHVHQSSASQKHCQKTKSKGDAKAEDDAQTGDKAGDAVRGGNAERRNGELGENVWREASLSDRAFDSGTPCVMAVRGGLVNVGEAVGVRRRTRRATRQRGERKRALGMYLRESGRRVEELMQVWGLQRVELRCGVKGTEFAMGDEEQKQRWKERIAVWWEGVKADGGANTRKKPRIEKGA